MIRFPCDYCERPLEVPDELIGTSKKCPACSEESQVPVLADLSKAVPQNHLKLWLIVVAVLLLVAGVFITMQLTGKNETASDSSNSSSTNSASK